MTNDKEKRTFETRLQFISSIFTNPKTPEEIYRASIEHRLGRTYEAYLNEVNQSLDILLEKNALTVAKKINKGEEL